MPYCWVPRHDSSGELRHDNHDDMVQIFYRTYGEGDCKVMMIMGVAATYRAWWPQIKPLAGTNLPNDVDDDVSDDGTMTDPDDVDSPAMKDAAARFEKIQIQSELDRRFDDSDSAATSSSADNPNSSACARPAFFERLDTEDTARSSNGAATTREENKKKLTGRMVCVLDNRGIGRSSHPPNKKDYKTELMAADIVAVADELGWNKFHVIGHSMGGMIACKVAASVPDRVLSLALISTSTGGFDLLPRLEMRIFRLVSRMLAAKTPHERAAVDLDTHFSEGFLSELVDGLPRRHHLHTEYVRTLSMKGSMQPKHAQDGQIHACWHHGLSSADVASICKADIPTTVIHGSDDIIAHVSLGRRVAKRLHPVARFVELTGGHMIIRERVNEVNGALIQLINAAHFGTKGHAWAASDASRQESDAKLSSCGLFCPDLGCAYLDPVARVFYASLDTSDDASISYNTNFSSPARTAPMAAPRSLKFDF